MDKDDGGYEIMHDHVDPTICLTWLSSNFSSLYLRAISRRIVLVKANNQQRPELFWFVTRSFSLLSLTLKTGPVQEYQSPHSDSLASWEAFRARHDLPC